MTPGKGIISLCICKWSLASLHLIIYTSEPEVYCARALLCNLIKINFSLTRLLRTMPFWTTHKPDITSSNNIFNTYMYMCSLDQKYPLNHHWVFGKSKIQGSLDTKRVFLTITSYNF